MKVKRGILVLIMVLALGVAGFGFSACEEERTFRVVYFVNYPGIIRPAAHDVNIGASFVLPQIEKEGYDLYWIFYSSPRHPRFAAGSTFTYAMHLTQRGHALFLEAYFVPEFVYIDCIECSDHGCPECDENLGQAVFLFNINRDIEGLSAFNTVVPLSNAIADIDSALANWQGLEILPAQIDHYVLDYHRARLQDLIDGN